MSKSNAEIAREIVGSWNGVLDYPPVSDTDKRDMQSTIERVLTTAQSDLARQVLAETQRSRSVGEVSGRLRSLFAQLGIDIT